ncbi:hypothetical protein MKX03_029048 [Papaver bracteatum]|nr:hypothetical protein MKX03_029048 [Papaver bracteatum]
MSSKDEKGGDHKFSEEYMVLKPQGGHSWDLLHFLFSHNVDINKFVECSEGMKVHGVKNRWILVLSVILQKILHRLAKPMYWLGWVIETYLNLVFNYDNFSCFLFGLLHGKLVIPDKSSAKYMSTIGNFDTRFELYKNIKNGDPRYHGALSAVAAKLAYENEALVKDTITNKWKMEFLGFYDFWDDFQDEASTQAYMFQDRKDDPELVVVAFRGTEMFSAVDWSSDFDVSWYGLLGIGKIHGGFMKALGLQKGLGWPQDLKQPENDKRMFAYYTLREKLKDILRKNDKAKVIVTGHSLGGALAIVFPTVLAFHKEDLLLKRFEGVYTFGQPRVGDEKLGEFLKEKLRINGVKYLRYVYCNDLIPRVPFDNKSFLFKHFGTCLYFNSLYQGKVVEVEPNKNYFNPAKVLLMSLTGGFELIRCFFIGYVMGPDYSETWCMALLRLFAGMIIPGLPAHFPREYLNVTRLASSNIYDIPPDQTVDLTKDLLDKQGGHTTGVSSIT